MPLSAPTPVPHLSWSQVILGFSFVEFNSVVLAWQMLRLDIGVSLAIAALRCMVQLTVVTVFLRYMFPVRGVWAVMKITRTFLMLLQNDGTLTRMAASATGCPQGIRDRCVLRCHMNRHVTDRISLVIKAERRCQLMVRHSVCVNLWRQRADSLLLCLHFPVFCRVHGPITVDYPGVYPRSTLRDENRSGFEPRTVPLVTISPF